MNALLVNPSITSAPPVRRLSDGPDKLPMCLPPRWFRQNRLLARCERCLVIALLLCFGGLLKTAAEPAHQQVHWHEGFEGKNLEFRWQITQGNWRIGPPQTGPTNAFAGTNCAFVGLNGSYPSGVNSSFVSPMLTLPPATDQPRLRFWHWFRIYPDGDYGQVRIRLENGTEEVLSEKYDYWSTDWSLAQLDLTKYGGQKVQILFHFISNSRDSWAGWLIDEIELVSGSTLFQGFDDFESGWGGWSTTAGNWFIGATGAGLNSPFSGTNCAGVTVTGDPYPNGVDSSLASAPIRLPSANSQPRLRFWHLIRIYPDGDYGQVRIRLENGEVEALSQKYDYWSTDWSPGELDLTKYGGQTVQILFHFVSNSRDAWAGWFIDNVSIETAPRMDMVIAVEGFEQGWGEWYTTKGNWSVGKPETGPTSTPSGVNCAGVLLNGSYPNGINSALVSPRFWVPPAEQNPRLSLQQWFRIYPDGDFGEIRVLLDDGTVETLSPKYDNTSGGWSPVLLPLAKYGGKFVSFMFQFTSNSRDSWEGWFIDDVRVIPPVRNVRPAFTKLPAQLARPNEPLEFTVLATDTDAGQTLTYSMDANSAPANAVFDPATRKFSWTPTVEDSERTGYHVIFRVTDDGSPALRDVMAVPIAVRAQADGASEPAARIVPSLALSHRQDYQGNALWLLGGMAGFEYTLQHSSDLNTWTTVLDKLKLRHGQVPRLVAPARPEENVFYRLSAEVSAPAASP
jgi:Putative Ig domain